MDVFELTRALVDIESITNNEERVGQYLFDYLGALASRYDGEVERIDVEARRFNVFAQFGNTPTVVLSTHIDTVPPFVASMSWSAASGVMRASWSIATKNWASSKENDSAI